MINKEFSARALLPTEKSVAPSALASSGLYAAPLPFLPVKLFRVHCLMHHFARFLTVLCFFHFAGVNNGYTAMMAAAPHPVEAVSLASGFARSSLATLRTPALQTIRSSQKLFYDVILGARQFLSAQIREVERSETRLTNSVVNKGANTSTLFSRGEGFQLISLKLDSALSSSKADGWKDQQMNGKSAPPPLLWRALSRSDPDISRVVQFLSSMGGGPSRLQHRTLNFSSENNGDSEHSVNNSAVPFPNITLASPTRVIFFGAAGR